MSELFKNKPNAEKKSIRYEIRVSEKDAKNIRESALIRNLSISEFIRRASLGRRADVGLEVEIILSLRSVVQSIRQLNSTCAVTGVTFPKDELGILIDHALSAMLRISK